MDFKSFNTIRPLGFYWETYDPFIFCVHHDDYFPKGNEGMGPDPSLLKGRNIGSDFTPRDGWRMYHGDRVPGFPVHPHRGFETVTIVRDGYVDHSDSLGASGRYGNGDVQWMTAGAGIQHCEMFPLVNTEKDNHCELFQIWLNLPRKNKMVEPHYSMLWAEDVPVISTNDKNGKNTSVTLIEGMLDGVAAPPPAPNSYAADPENNVSIMTIIMEPGAEWILPGVRSEVQRTIYFFKGETIRIGGDPLAAKNSVIASTSGPLTILNGSSESEILILQAKPINEPVFQHGPFVMNSEEEIRQTIFDYRQTQFGGWPWKRTDNVHPRDAGRFAKYADGTTENPG
jgi:redox-sensitive bicupin YhaK (pirin superfamily)